MFQRFKMSKIIWYWKKTVICSFNPRLCKWIISCWYFFVCFGRLRWTLSGTNRGTCKNFKKLLNCLSWKRIFNYCHYSQWWTELK